MLRIGKVTDINVAKGTLRVLYEDFDNASYEMPLMKAADMPEIGEYILTAHDAASGVVIALGGFWGGSDVAADASDDYRHTIKKRLSSADAIIKYNNSKITVYAPEIEFSNAVGTKTLTEIIGLFGGDS